MSPAATMFAEGYAYIVEIMCWNGPEKSKLFRTIDNKLKLTLSKAFSTSSEIIAMSLSGLAFFFFQGLKVNWLLSKLTLVKRIGTLRGKTALYQDTSQLNSTSTLRMLDAAG